MSVKINETEDVLECFEWIKNEKLIGDIKWKKISKQY